MLRNFICILLTCGITFLKAQVPAPIAPDSIENYIQKIVNYLKQEQVSKSIEGFEYKGEWPSTIRFRTGFFMLPNPGLGKYDSNCFSIAGVHNSLANCFFLRPDISEIPVMMDRAMPQIMSYYSDGGFNFWPLLPPSGRFSYFHKNRKDDLVRRPVQYKLASPFIRKAANIVNDNDDTSQGLLALVMNARMHKHLGETVDFEIQMSPVLCRWRDTLRVNQHWYNILHFDKRESGAFCTWRGQEESFPSWNFPRLLVNNATFFLPKNTHFPKPFQAYIPYGSNDVDAVVNANVLTALAMNGESSAPGVYSSVKFIERKVDRKKWSRAGIYYPNRYNFHYAVLKAQHAGIKGLSPSADKLIDHIKASVNEDGSFESRKIVNKKDEVQSTVYALNALLYAGNPYKNGNFSIVEKSIRYLISQARNHNENICWEGGIFFSGGTVIRNTMFWKSDAYTTALILESLILYQHFTETSETFQKAQSRSLPNAPFD
jgi:hypothetical protein